MYTHLKEKQATKDETTIKDNFKKIPGPIFLTVGCAPKSKTCGCVKK